MSRLLPLLLAFILFPATLHAQPSIAPSPPRCPLNFTALRPFLAPPLPSDDASRCAFALQSVRLLLSLHLAATGSFLVPNSSCLPPLRDALPFPLSPPDACGLAGIDALLSAPGCGNISTRGDFDNRVPASARRDINASCYRELGPVPVCTACTTSLSKTAAAYLLPGSPDGGNDVTGCVQYPFIYAGAAASLRGPDDPDTANCLYLLNVNPEPSNGPGASAWLYGVVLDVSPLYC